MAKSKNKSGWKFVKDILGFGSKTTTTTTTKTFKLSRSESEKLKKEICITISGASKDMLDGALASSLDFAKQCNDEFKCNHLGGTIEEFESS